MKNINFKKIIIVTIISILVISSYNIIKNEIENSIKNDIALEETEQLNIVSGDFNYEYIENELLVEKISLSESYIIEELNQENTTESELDIKILEEQIEEYLIKNNIDENEVSIVIENLENNEKIEINEEQYFTAASIYKLPLALIYYDMINNKEVELTDLYQLLSSHIEGAGVLTSKYSINSYIDLEYILEVMIEYSDNEAGHILFENLGGWSEFKEISLKYSIIDSSTEFIEGNNLTTQYINDVIRHIYENSDDYVDLIEDMKKATRNQYLDIGIDAEVAQKYGWYNEALNAVGIVYADTPYSISIFTELYYETGCEVVEDINEMCYEYFSE